MVEKQSKLKKWIGKKIQLTSQYIVRARICSILMFFKHTVLKKLCIWIQAARVFEEVRRIEPYHIDGLDFYSSVLWHLHKEVELSLLAQELSAMDKMSAQAWFATGNCFSLQKEHDVAIKFFQRAIQVCLWFGAVDVLIFYFKNFFFYCQCWAEWKCFSAHESNVKKNIHWKY